MNDNIVGDEDDDKHTHTNIYKNVAQIKHNAKSWLICFIKKNLSPMTAIIRKSSCPLMEFHLAENQNKITLVKN